jgi:hypothetical protein
VRGGNYAATISATETLANSVLEENSAGCCGSNTQWSTTLTPSGVIR